MQVTPDPVLQGLPDGQAVYKYDFCLGHYNHYGYVRHEGPQSFIEDTIKDANGMARRYRWAEFGSEVFTYLLAADYKKRSQN